MKFVPPMTRMCIIRLPFHSKVYRVIQINILAVGMSNNKKAMLSA
jgi:hypothetical protein